jgi:colanic acid biosynthesis glycosyl transferase WcaI
MGQPRAPEDRRSRLWLVNRFGPPDTAPTSRLLGELGDGMGARGWAVEKVVLPPGYDRRRRGIWRYGDEVLAHLRLFVALLWRAGRGDIVLCFSDPPCLPVTVAAVARLRGAVLVQWSMDLYPELAVALGEIADGRVAGLLRRLMRAARRQAVLVVGLDGDMRGRFEAEGGIHADEIRPWPPAAGRPRAEQEDGRRGVGAAEILYSGNLGRAHEFESLLQMQGQLERRHPGATRMVFQGGGASWEAARGRGRELGLANLDFRPYVPEHELLARLAGARLLAATQLPEVAGLLWPSKLALLYLLPRPLIWVGDPGGAIGRWLARREAPTGLFRPGQWEEMAAWVAERLEEKLVEIDWAELERRCLAAREDGLERWHRRLNGLRLGVK